MSSLKAQYDALQQQHELTVIQLSDLKQDYERIKKLNTTILENMMKEPSDFYNEIKVIIDGNLYSQKIVDLELELERLRALGNQEVERRVQEIVGNIKRVQIQSSHDCEKCEKCLKLRLQCPSCQQYMEFNKKLEKVISEKSEKIESLRIQIHEKEHIIQSSNNRKLTDRISELEQINRMLKASMQEHEDSIRDHEMSKQNLHQEWESEYNNLREQYDGVVEQLEHYRLYYENQEDERSRKSLNSKKDHMVQQIQNLVGEMGNSRKPLNNVYENNLPRQSRMSRGGGQDGDFSCFSIKDGVNRPSQISFY